MQICLDAHMIGGRETGNESYVAALAPALARQPGVRCVAALDPGAAAPDGWAEGQPDLARLRTAGNWARLTYTLPRLCRERQADILHVTYVAPLISPCPRVVTVHDVSFRRYPEFFSARDRLLFATLLRLTLRRAAAIITDSASSRADILHFYPWTAGKLHVVPLAASPAFRPVGSPEERQAICARFGGAHGYILAVGNLQPRKNMPRLVAAFRSLLAQGITDRQLVLVGKDALRSDQFRAEVQDLIASGHLLLPGYMPERDLPALYSAASVFVYPSLYEGFGLPILEAMACGTPVVTSSCSSMPEVAGSAALLIDPLRTEQIASALRTVLEQPSLARALAAQGRARAAQFTWDATAQQTVDVYRLALQSGATEIRDQLLRR
jgi:glycosyltransferase involved in cell wall biosynthesis